MAYVKGESKPSRCKDCTGFVTWDEQKKAYGYLMRYLGSKELVVEMLPRCRKCARLELGRREWMLGHGWVNQEGSYVHQISYGLAIVVYQDGENPGTWMWRVGGVVGGPETPHCPPYPKRYRYATASSAKEAAWNSYVRQSYRRCGNSRLL